MAKFHGINAVLVPKTASKAKQRKAAAGESRKEKGAKYLLDLVRGRLEVTRYNAKEKQTYRKEKDASPSELLELLRKALRCGVTVDDVRHAQQSAKVDNAEYQFLAQRFPWTQATSAILEGFEEAHHQAVATILGFELVTPAEVEEAATQEEQPKAKGRGRRQRKAS